MPPDDDIMFHFDVIKSVFGNMAKAIIHNSDYQSTEEARQAMSIMKHNLAFQENPRRAGKKIWRKEIVPSRFAEDQNCKDPCW